jgi:hypothetical protein
MLFPIQQRSPRLTLVFFGLARISFRPHPPPPPLKKDEEFRPHSIYSRFLCILMLMNSRYRYISNTNPLFCTWLRISSASRGYIFKIPRSYYFSLHRSIPIKLHVDNRNLVTASFKKYTPHPWRKTYPVRVTVIRNSVIHHTPRSNFEFACLYLPFD